MAFFVVYRLVKKLFIYPLKATGGVGLGFKNNFEITRGVGQPTKNRTKNIVPSKSYGFLKICVAIKLIYPQIIHLDTMHARKFGMYLRSMTFHKSDAMISKI